MLKKSYDVSFFSQTGGRKMVYGYCTTSHRGFIIGKVTFRLEHSEKDIRVNVLHLLPNDILWVIIKFLLSKYKVYELDNVVIFFYSMHSIREDFVRLNQMLNMGNNMKQEYFNQRYFFLCRLIERISRHLSTNNLDANYEFNLAAGESISL